jgi:hypothetical protein
VPDGLYIPGIYADKGNGIDRSEVNNMSNHAVSDADMESIFLAGEIAPAGLYQRLGTPHTVRLTQQDYLPATLDGRVACYTRVHSLWSELDDLASVKNRLSLPIAA